MSFKILSFPPSPTTNESAYHTKESTAKSSTSFRENADIVLLAFQRAVISTEPLLKDRWRISKKRRPKITPYPTPRLVRDSISRTCCELVNEWLQVGGDHFEIGTLVGVKWIRWMDPVHLSRREGAACIPEKANTMKIQNIIAYTCDRRQERGGSKPQDVEIIVFIWRNYSSGQKFRCFS